MMAFLTELDRSLFFLINRSGRNPILDWAMPVISGKGGYLLIPVGLLVLYIIFRGSARSRWMIFALASVAAMGDSLSTFVLKPFFGRPRPYSVLENIFVYKEQWILSDSIPAHATLSFPSNHAVNIGAIAAILIYFYPRLWPLPAALALLVCVSRVYLGLHYPADVMFGLAVGAACAGVFLLLQKGLLKLFPEKLSFLNKEIDK